MTPPPYPPAVCVSHHAFSPPLPSLPPAHISSKRLTDHNEAAGCRPALNIDVLRIIGVCKTVAQLKAALQKLGEVRSAWRGAASHLLPCLTLQPVLCPPSGL